VRVLAVLDDDFGREDLDGRADFVAATVDFAAGPNLDAIGADAGALFVGPHKVSVKCYSSQRPSEISQKKAGEATLGELLIPSEYTFMESSGLTADVPANGVDTLVFELEGPDRTFPQ
jgi:hypothetical protein